MLAMINPILLGRAIRKAAQSQCKQRVAALGLDRNGNCVMARTNKPRFSRKGGGLHAERQIMEQARKKGIVRILICRVGKGGNLRPIHPCKTCASIAEKLGIPISTVPYGNEETE